MNGESTLAAGGAAGTFERTSRLPAFFGGDGREAERIAGLRWAVLGVGAVGRSVALHLARLMPTELILVDPKAYKRESLATQAILPQDVGHSKAFTTAEMCREISPATEVRAIEGTLEELDLPLFATLDAVFLATDNLNAEMQAGWRCAGSGVPLIQASVDGATLTAQVRLFRNGSGAGPCPICGFGAREWADMYRQTRFSCDPDGPRDTADVTGPPTFSVSALCSLAADLAVLQSLRLSLELGPDVGDTLLEYNAYRCRSVLSPIVRSDDCPADHGRWEVADPPRPIRLCTLAELAACVAVPADRIERTAFTLDRGRFYKSGICQNGHQQVLDRFVVGPFAGPDCGTCGSPTWPSHFHSHRPVPGSALREVIHCPLEEISEATVRWVMVRDGTRATLFRDPTPVYAGIPEKPMNDSVSQYTEDP